MNCDWWGNSVSVVAIADFSFPYNRPWLRVFCAGGTVCAAASVTRGPRLEARETSSLLAMHQADWQQMADYQLLHSIINSLLKSHWISDTGGLMCYYRGQIIQWENWQLWKSKMISLSLKFLFNIPVFAEIKSTLTKSASTEQVSSSNAAYCCVGLHKGVFIFWVNTPQCSQKRYMVSEQSNSTIQTLEVTNV